MCIKGDDILEASLLKAADNKPRASQTSAEEATFLGEDPASQEAWKTTRHCPDHPEETPRPEGAAGLADRQDAQEQVPPLPPGFGLPTPLSGPPPLEDAGPLVSIPRETQLDVTSLASTEMIMVRNSLMGEFECCY